METLIERIASLKLAIEKCNRNCDKLALRAAQAELRAMRRPPVSAADEAAQDERRERMNERRAELMAEEAANRCSDFYM